jgi:hypothetical protein
MTRTEADTVLLGLIALVLTTVSGVCIAFGLWLVFTPDADGGRRPTGFIILAFGVLVGLAASVVIRSAVNRR